MTLARAKAPTLAWLLTVLTGLLVGMAVVESRHQAVALPVWAPVGTTETVALATTPPLAAESIQTTPSSTPTPMLGPGEELTLSRTLLLDDALVGLTAGAADLRIERLALPSGTSLPAAVAAGPTVLVVETGTLYVLIDSAVYVGQGLDAVQTRTFVPPGQRLVVAAGERHTIRNDGSTPAVALVVAIVPVETPTPMFGPGGTTAEEFRLRGFRLLDPGMAALALLS